MDRELIENEIKRLSEELSRLKVGTPEYRATSEALKDLHAMLMNDERAESERIEKNMTMDLRKEELEFKVLECEQKAKTSKHSDWVGFLKALGCGALALVGMYFLDETKENQGFVDKDKFAMIKSMFPRG